VWDMPSNWGFKCVRAAGPSLITVQLELAKLFWVKIDVYLSIV